MAIALKDFRYYDFQQKRSIEVHAGQEMGVDFMAQHNIDPGKMVRTKYVAVSPEEESSVMRRPTDRERAVIRSVPARRQTAKRAKKQ